MKGGTREKLVERMIVKFGIKGNVDVPKQTIHSRIKVERLKVWHTGTTSPLIMVEAILNAYIIGAWMINCPLTVSRCVKLMNNLISGTRFERNLIKWKIQKRIYNSNLEVPLVGMMWWELYKRRNPEIVSKAGTFFAWN